MTKLIFGLGKSGQAIRDFFDSRGIEYICHDDRNVQNDITLDAIDECFISPGISPQNHFVQKLKAHGILIYSELDLAFRYFKGKIIAITGTNGKSTTTKMIEHIFKKQGKSSIACGNIGLPFVSICDQNYEYACVEVSSYQIEWSKEFEPDLTVLTSLSFDHIERHGSLDHYHQIKLSLNSPYICPIGLQSRIEQLQSPTDISYVPNLQNAFLSQHDNQNASLAYAAVGFFGSVINTELNDYVGLEHRFEVFLIHQNRRFINDSKSTNLESLLSALNSIDQPCILLCGGQGKGEDFSPLLASKDRIKCLYTFGRDGAKIANDLHALKPKVYGTLSALIQEVDFSKTSHDVLLSPGCASFDEFKDFEDRGRFFKKSILESNKKELF